METQSKKIIVVLGMHRSGTSAVTRGLKVLGVELGDNLHPAKFENPKGFWEDRDFLAINEELLTHIGFTYDGLGLVNWDMQQDQMTQLIRIRAERFVEEKCKKESVWGFKDPRVARLLPFWQIVFEHVGYDVGYVIAIRNPISVAESLRKRNGFDSEKSYYLWLEHLVPAILRTKGKARVVVDYDRILENPGLELSRIARAMGLPAPEPLALAHYEHEFLEKGLRHTRFTITDLNDRSIIPAPVVTAYDWLVKSAMDDAILEGQEVERVFDALAQELLSLSPALNFMARQEQEIVNLQRVIAQRDTDLRRLSYIESEYSRVLRHLFFGRLLRFWRRFINSSFPAEGDS